MNAQTFAPNSAQIDRTANAGQLPPEVRAGLADPLARIAVTTVTRDGGRRLDCYAIAGTEKGLTSVTPNADGGVAVSFPVDAALTEALIAETLGLDQPLADIGHRSELDIAALWALAAMADAHRQIELESLLTRTSAHPIALDEDAIYMRALDGATLSDPRWLSAMLTHLIGPGDVTEPHLHDGLAALARSGMIVRSSNGLWSPQPAFVTAFAHLEMPLSGARLSIDRRGADCVDQATFVFLRTLAAIWIIELRGPAEAPTHVLLRSIGANDAIKFIHDAIALALTAERTLPKLPPAIPKEAAASRFCQQCSRPVGIADRFCGGCGAGLT